MTPSTIERSNERSILGHALSHEFLLLAACCVWPPSSRRTAAIRRAVGETIDWEEFLRLTERHRVAGLAHHGLSTGKINPPPAIAQTLAREATRIAGQNLAHAAEMRRLQRLFDNAGAPVCFVKGVSLGLLAYGSLGLKHGKDIDILVPAASAELALNLLEKAGYRLCPPYCDIGDDRRRLIFRYSKDLGVMHSRTGVQVELHWRLTDNPQLLKNIDASSPGRVVALTNDCGFRTLNERDLFAYLCVHGAMHGWSRLKWLADARALLAGTDADGIISLYCHAKACGAGLCAGQTLLLCERLLDWKLPPPLDNELHASRKFEKLAAAALAAMTSTVIEADEEGGVGGGSRAYLRRFSLGEGWAFYAAQIRARSVALADVARFPLRGPLRCLYPFLRPVLWLWRRGRMCRVNRRR
jgi:hypothetical protein